MYRNAMCRLQNQKLFTQDTKKASDVPSATTQSASAKKWRETNTEAIGSGVVAQLVLLDVSGVPACITPKVKGGKDLHKANAALQPSYAALRPSWAFENLDNSILLGWQTII